MSELDEKYKSLEEAIYLWEVAKRENKRNGFQYTETNADFIAYTNYIAETETYTLNHNLFKSDRYFILNVREQYKNGFDIKGSYEEYSVVEAPELVKSVTYEDMVTIYNETKNIEDYKYKTDYYNLIKESIKLYGKVWVNYTYTKQMVDNYSNEYTRVILTIRNSFKEDKGYTVKEIKDRLQTIYDEFKIGRKAKSTDLQEFMTVREYRTNEGRFVEVINKNKTTK
jgi:hypothetical protein